RRAPGSLSSDRGRADRARCRSRRRAGRVCPASEHVPQKWEPVLRKGHARTKVHVPQKWEPVLRKGHARTKVHVPQKWEPVLRKGHAQTNNQSTLHPALTRFLMP